MIYPYLAAKTVTGIPAWAFSLTVTMIMGLIGIIGYFARREFKRYEEKIHAFSVLLYGETKDDGRQINRIKGIMEKIEDYQDDIDSFKYMENQVAEQMSQIDVFQKEIDRLAKRVKHSEDWMLEEGARNREAIKKLEKKTDESRDVLSEIKGKLDILMSIVTKKE